MQKEELKFAQDLLDFIHSAPSRYHVIEQMKLELERFDFIQLNPAEAWELKKGGKYFTSVNGSSMVAFIVGTGEPAQAGFRVLEGHTDSPEIKIKPLPDIKSENYYTKLNAEVYGSPILNTWLDRPLNLAGRLSVRGKDALHPEDVLFNADRPLLYIPNLSIHHNREVNSGVELNKQKDMLPLLGITGDDKAEEKGFYKLIAEAAEVEQKDILDFELSATEYEKGTFVGPNSEFISSTKLDNLSSVHAGLHALLQAATGEASYVLCCFDNEEVGNLTKQGAGSNMLPAFLERITMSIGGGREEYLRSLQNSFMISADMAHGVHPNAPERSDPVNKVKLNGGPVIKVSGMQKFTSDSRSSAVFKMLCEEAGVPWQYYLNRSDSPGGSTAGSVSSAGLGMPAVDVGAALLAMHSIREIAGSTDHSYMLKVYRRFFSTVRDAG